MRILLVEDNADHRELMHLALTGHDATWQVEGVASGEEALRHLAEGEAYDVVFLDYSLPTRDGLEVLAEIRRGEAPPPVVMVTGRGDEQVAVEAMKGGAYDYIVKGEGYLQRLSVVAQRAVEATQLAVEHKRTEGALRESEGHYRRIVETANEGIWGIDGDSRTTFVNSQMASMLGYTDEEMIGRPLFSTMDEEWLAIAEAYVGHRRQGIRESHEFKFRRKDGTDLWAMVSATPILDTQGKYEGAFAMITDITERKRAEVAVRQTNQLLETILEFTHVLVAFMDSRFNFIWVNRAYVEADKREASFFQGKNHFALYPNAENEQIFRRVVETGEPYVVFGKPFEYAEHPERGVSYWDWSLVPIKNQQGAVERLVLTVANVTQRKLAEEALAARTRQLDAIRAVTTEISRELDLPTLLELIIRRAAELVGATSGVIFLWDGETQLLIPQAWHGLGDWMSEMSIPLGAGVTGTVAERREGMIVNDYRSSLHALPFFLEHTETTAVMAEPLLYRDQLVGVITINSEGGDRLFEEQNRETLRLFAAHAVIAIGNARLHSTTVRRGEELGALLRATRSVMAGLDLQGTLDRILGEAAQIAETPHVKILLLDQGAMVLRLRALAGRPAELLEGFQMPLGVGLSGIVAATGLLLFVPDCQHDPRNLYAEQDRQLGLVTYLGLPIIIRGNVAGVLTFNTEQPRRYTSDELAYLASFADQAAIAIENARLFEQVSVGRERLEALSRRLVEVQETERRNIARELHDEIGQLLTGLRLIIEMSLRARPEALQARLGEARGLVSDLMERVRELSLNLRPAMLDDLGLLPALLWLLERFSVQTQMRVDLQHSGLERRLLPELETAVYRIVQEALTNVARHAGVQEAVVRLCAEEDTLVVRVQDRGTGFDPEAALAAVASSGLAGMRDRVALLGGQFTIESAHGAGTRLTAEFPLGEGRSVRRET